MKARRRKSATRCRNWRWNWTCSSSTRPTKAEAGPARDCSAAGAVEPGHRKRRQVQLRQATHVDRGHRLAAARIDRFTEWRDAALAAEVVPDVVRVELIRGHFRAAVCKLERGARREPQQAATTTAQRAVAVDDIGDRRFGLDHEGDPAAVAASVVLHVQPSDWNGTRVILWHADSMPVAAYPCGSSL